MTRGCMSRLKCSFALSPNIEIDNTNGNILVCHLDGTISRMVFDISGISVVIAA